MKIPKVSLDMVKNPLLAFPNSHRSLEEMLVQNYCLDISRLFLF